MNPLYKIDTSIIYWLNSFVQSKLYRTGVIFFRTKWQVHHGLSMNWNKALLCVIIVLNQIKNKPELTLK